MHGSGQIMNINKYFYKELIFLYVTPIVSATFLLLIQVLGEPIKNYDGLLYLRQASELLNGSGFYTVFNSKDSFLLPFLVYLLSNSLKISLLNSFYILLFVSNFFIAHFFFKIYLKFSKLKNNFYVVLIFFSFIAYFDNYGPMLLRDHVAWAFFLCAIFYLLRYSLNNNRVDAFLFLLASLSGTFFRVELVFICLFIFFIVNFHSLFSLKDVFLYFILVGGFFLAFAGIYDHLRSHDLFYDTRLSLLNISYIIKNFRFDLIYIPEILISFLKNCFFIIPLYLIVIFDKKILKNNQILYILNLIIIFSLGVCIFHAMVTDIFSSRYLMFSLIAVNLATILNFNCDTKLKKRYVLLLYLYLS